MSPRLIFACLVSGLTLLLPGKAFAQSGLGSIYEITGYVNTQPSQLFEPGDTLTGTHRASVAPPEEELERLYWVKARFVDNAGEVTGWVYDTEAVSGGGQAQLAAVASQYTVPLASPSPYYEYAVELKCDDPIYMEIMIHQHRIEFTMNGE